MASSWMRLVLAPAVIVGGSMIAHAEESAGAIGAEVADDLIHERMAAIVARMSPDMAAALPVARLGAVWQATIGQLGPCKTVGAARVDKNAGYDLVKIPLVFDTQTLEFRLSLAAGKIVGLFLIPAEAAPLPPPAYANPAAFHEVEIHFGPAPFALPGTLSLPVAAKKVPAVVLVHGSGPNDRDESAGPNRPFRDIAMGLASRGIAVLRYDKRTKVFPQAFVAMKTPTVRGETMDDAHAAVAFLKARPEIDPARIVLVGHSLGGTLAPRIALDDASIAGIVILAGATRPMADLIAIQTEYLMSLAPAHDPQDDARLAAIRAEVLRARSARADDDKPIFGVPASYWADLNTYDPAAAAAKLTIPVLILQGDRDYQVTLEDLKGFETALSGHANVAIHRLAALNHLFMPGKGRSTPAEYAVPGHVDGGVIDLVAAFVLRN